MSDIETRYGSFDARLTTDLSSAPTPTTAENRLVPITTESGLSSIISPPSRQLSAENSEKDELLCEQIDISEGPYGTQRTGLISKEEILDRYRNGDVEALEILISLSLDMAEEIINGSEVLQRHLRTSSTVSHEDLIQEAMVSLMSSVRRYDARKGLFDVYARRVIYRCMRDFANEHGTMFRIPPYTGKTDDCNPDAGIIIDRAINARLIALSLDADNLGNSANDNCAYPLENDGFKNGDLPDGSSLTTDYRGDEIELLVDRLHNTALMLSLLEGSDLSAEEKIIAQMRFGLFGQESKERSKVAEEFNITTDQVQRIESKLENIILIHPELSKANELEVDKKIPAGGHSIARIDKAPEDWGELEKIVHNQTLRLAMRADISNCSTGSVAVDILDLLEILDEFNNMDFDLNKAREYVSNLGIESSKVTRHSRITSQDYSAQIKRNQLAVIKFMDSFAGNYPNGTEDFWYNREIRSMILLLDDVYKYITKKNPLARLDVINNTLRSAMLFARKS